MSNSHFSSYAVFPPLDFILGNKSITSNFMTTSALADMIEREFHSCQVILFLNLFFIIPEKHPVLSSPIEIMEATGAEFTAHTSIGDPKR